MFLVTLYLYKNIENTFIALQETNFLKYFPKLLMSHCSKTQIAERYKITILIITFLFGNGFEVWDMQNIQ